MLPLLAALAWTCRAAYRGSWSVAVRYNRDHLAVQCEWVARRAAGRSEVFVDLGRANPVLGAGFVKVKAVNR